MFLGLSCFETSSATGWRTILSQVESSSKHTTAALCGFGLLLVCLLACFSPNKCVARCLSSLWCLCFRRPNTQPSCIWQDAQSLCQSVFSLLAPQATDKARLSSFPCGLLGFCPSPSKVLEAGGLHLREHLRPWDPAPPVRHSKAEILRSHLSASSKHPPLLFSMDCICLLCFVAEKNTVQIRQT